MLTERSKSNVRGILKYHLFMKRFSQNFEVLTQRGDVVNTKLARRRAQTHISRTNGDINLQRYVFSQNFALNINPSWTFSLRHFGHF